MMTPIELRARREALGLSQSLLAQLLDTIQVNINRWEKGHRPIPSWMEDRLAELEEWTDNLTELTYRHIGLEGVVIDDEGAHDASALAVIVHETDESYWAAHPEDAPMPAVLQRVAAVRAMLDRRAEGLDVILVPAGLSVVRE